jgi:hypothetical protein
MCGLGRAQQFSAGSEKTKPIRVEQKSPDQLQREARAAAQADSSAQEKAIRAQEDTAPRSVVDYAKDHEWQKHAEVRTGNVILLRRSTDVPTKPNETVILRWRTPTEFARQQGVSSKGVSSAQQRLIDARARME